MVRNAHHAPGIIGSPDIGSLIVKLSRFFLFDITGKYSLLDAYFQVPPEIQDTASRFRANPPAKLPKDCPIQRFLPIW
jgi:hypothetical protein